MSGAPARRESGTRREPAGSRTVRIVGAIVLLLLVAVLAALFLRRSGARPEAGRAFVAKVSPPPAPPGATASDASGAEAGASAPAKETDAGTAESQGTAPAGGPGEAGRRAPAPGRAVAPPPVVLDGGELRMFLSGAVSLPVVVGEARTSLAVESTGAGRAAEVLVAAVPDGTAAVSVLSGTVDVVAGGRRLRVGAGTFTAVANGAAPAPAEAVPPPPDPGAPSQDATFLYGTVPPRITFSWRPRAAADAFRLVVARDPEFRRVVVDERVADRSVAQGGLEQGIYYWRVSAVRKGAAGPPGEIARLNVVCRNRPPGLAVRQAVRIDGGNAWLVTGRTEPGSKVFVAGNPVAVTEAGTFSCRLPRVPVAGAVVVEAVDPLGNAAWHRQWVY